MATTRRATKVQSSMRVSQDAKKLLEKLSRKLSISQSAILELAIRQMAEREGVK